MERALPVVAASDLLMPTLLAVSGGMHRGEVLGFRWRDLDFETGTVRLSQTVRRIRAGLDIPGPGRTGAGSFTYVGMPDDHDRAAAAKFDALAPVMASASNP